MFFVLIIKLNYSFFIYNFVGEPGPSALNNLPEVELIPSARGNNELHPQVLIKVDGEDNEDSQSMFSIFLVLLKLQLFNFTNLRDILIIHFCLVDKFVL